MKKNKIIIILLAIVILTSCKISSPDDFNKSDIDGDAIGIATIMIECKTILDNLDKLDDGVDEILPSDGVILAETSVDVYEDDTAFTVLMRVAKSKKILVNSSNNSYITGIAGITEFSCGELSGWKYKVNDEFSSTSVSQQEIAVEDKLAFLFTCDLGDDLE